MLAEVVATAHDEEEEDGIFELESTSASGRTLELSIYLHSMIDSQSGMGR
jgi:hypothetical protein